MKPGNILKIDSLTKDWWDKDRVMLHACFQLLKDCVEGEDLFTGTTDWTYDEDRKAIKDELESLYLWWNNRSKMESFTISEEEYEKQDKEDDKMLAKLISFRHLLWT